MKKQNTKYIKRKGDYLKSIWANKLTLLGYGCLIPLIANSIVYEMTGDHSNAMAMYFSLNLSTVGLFGTAFGLQTLYEYRRARNGIIKKGIIPERYKKEIDEEGHYCVKKGLELAIKEAERKEK